MNRTDVAVYAIAAAMICTGILMFWTGVGWATALEVTAWLSRVRAATGPAI